MTKKQITSNKKKKKSMNIFWVPFLIYQLQSVSSTPSSSTSATSYYTNRQSNNKDEDTTSTTTANIGSVDSSLIEPSSSTVPLHYGLNPLEVSQHQQQKQQELLEQYVQHISNVKSEYEFIDTNGRNSHSCSGKSMNSIHNDADNIINADNEHIQYGHQKVKMEEQERTNIDQKGYHQKKYEHEEVDDDNDNIEEIVELVDEDDDQTDDDESISSDGGADDEYETEEEEDDDDGETSNEEDFVGVENEPFPHTSSSHQYKNLKMQQSKNESYPSNYYNVGESAIPRNKSIHKSITPKYKSKAEAQKSTSSLSQSSTSSSQPLRTLKKLQAMLEDTDYVTSSTSDNRQAEAYDEHTHQLLSGTESYNQDSNDSCHDPDDDTSNNDEIEVTDKLWTSKDRSKYRKQQKRHRRIEYERKQILLQQRMKIEEERQKQWKRQQQQQQQNLVSDDDSTGTDGIDDTDDGLGYTLPNLPVYFSDAESDSFDFDSGTIGSTGSSNIVKNKGRDQSDIPFSTDQTPSKSSQMPARKHEQLQQQQQYYSQQQPAYPQSPPIQQGQGPPYQYQTQQHMQQMYQQQQQSTQPGSTSQPIYPQHQQQRYNTPDQQFPFVSQQLQQNPQQQRSAAYNQNYPPQQYQFNNQSTYNPMSIQQQQAQYGQWHHGQQGYVLPPTQGYYTQQQYGPQRQTYFHLQQPQQYNPQQKFYPQPFLTKIENDLQSKGSNQSSPLSNDIDPASKNRIDSLKQNTQNNLEQVPQVTKIDNTEVQKIAMNDATMVSISGSSRVTFDSLQKLFFFSLSNMFLCYCAVSPRTLDLIEYNRSFKNNVHTAFLVFIAPLLELILVVEKKENDFNSLISTFYASATLGTFFALILEIGLTTLIRLAVFCIWEPSIFSLTPEVPLIVLPWTLRDHKYRPKRITLFAADFTTTCIAAPCIEEFVKLKVMQLSSNLPRNFRRRKLAKNELSKKKRRIRKRKNYAIEEIARKPNEEQVKSINGYVSHMLAASLGMKLADSVKRTMMYTKQDDVHQKFYAIMRGFYPVHELCGTMTALEVAKRDVLGLDIAQWRMLFPAVFIHGMANLKGMKPLFKWNSKTPWTELQFSESWWNIAQDSTLSQMFTKGFAKFMWFIILARVFGYCVKNYYMITRRAIKRTTIFAGKNAAFSAELKAADELKKLKKDHSK